MAGYINIDGLFWEMKAVIENNYCGTELTLNQKFNKMKKSLIEDFKDIIEQNKKEVLKEIKQE